MPNLPHSIVFSEISMHVWVSFVATRIHWVMLVQPDFLCGDKEDSAILGNPATPERCEEKERTH